jgi:hypothetical protein
MSDNNENDMIRRGAALAAAKGFIGAETAITALPAADPLADPRVQALVEALQMADTALYEAEAILGGEYGDFYGPLCDQISKLRATLAEIEGEKG